MAGEILSRVAIVVTFVLMALPVNYMLAKFLIYEEGAFGIFAWLRRVVGISESYKMDAETGELKKDRRITRRWWGSQVLFCYNCLSPYLSLIVAVAAAHILSMATAAGDVQATKGIYSFYLGLVMWLPLSGLTIMTFDYLGRPE